MSGLPIGASLVEFVDLSGFGSGDIVPYRVIDPDSSNLIAEVTIEEDHLDQLIVSEHPVEQSAAIADHAYRRPRELRLRVGWSNAYGGSPTYAEELYNALLGLQWQRRPFKIYTGKAYYQNMLMAELRVTTNSALEFTTLADITFHEVILVNTQTIPGGIPNNTSQLAIPAQTQPTTNSGSVGTSPVLVPGGALPLSTSGFPALRTGSGLTDEQ